MGRRKTQVPMPMVGMSTRCGGGSWQIYLASFLALAVEGRWERIVDTKWHFALDIGVEDVEVKNNEYVV